LKKILLKLLFIYQKYISIVFGYGQCRYYPTCSEYAKWQIENNNIAKALFFSFVRILRCNQLFKGGIEYPKIKKDFKISKLKPVKYNEIDIKYWFVPKKKNIFYVIKRFKRYKSVK